MRAERRSWWFRQWWRINKARSVISLVFWACTLPAVWYPIVRRVVPLPGAMLLALMGTIVLAAVFIIGYVWDRLRLWLPETEQAMLRSYAAYRPLPKEVMYTIPLSIANARAILTLVRDEGARRRLIEALNRLERWAYGAKGVDRKGA